MAWTSLEKHPGTDGLPDGLSPGWEGGRCWPEVPGVRLVHDGTEGRAEMNRGSVALPTLGLAHVGPVRPGHEVHETKTNIINIKIK